MKLSDIDIEDLEDISEAVIPYFNKVQFLAKKHMGEHLPEATALLMAYHMMLQPDKEEHEPAVAQAKRGVRGL